VIGAGIPQFVSIVSVTFLHQSEQQMEGQVVAVEQPSIARKCNIQFQGNPEGPIWSRFYHLLEIGPKSKSKWILIPRTALCCPYLLAKGSLLTGNTGGRKSTPSPFAEWIPCRRKK
jgi:hypothetical protein